MRTSQYCPTCEATTLHESDPNPVNHMAHLLATIFLCGFWLPIWILHTLLNLQQDIRCTRCGTAPQSDAPNVGGWIKNIAMVVFAFVVVVLVVSWLTKRPRDPLAVRPHVGPVAELPPHEFERHDEPVQRVERQPDPQFAQDQPRQAEQVQIMDAPRPVPADQIPPAIPPEDPAKAAAAEQAKLDAEAAEQKARQEMQERAAAGKLKAGGPLRGDAKTRWLKAVIKEYPGTVAAQQAQALLDSR